MAYILCNIFMFDLHQRVVLVNDEGQMLDVAIANLDNLSEMIADACAKHSVNNVRLIGQKDYATNVAEEICRYGVTKYGNNFINVEVN